MIPSPYLEAMREAWDDRRDVETLKAVAKRKGVDISRFPAKLGRDAVGLRGSWGSRTQYDPWGQAEDLPAIEEMRQRAASKILEVQRR